MTRRRLAVLLLPFAMPLSACHKGDNSAKTEPLPAITTGPETAPIEAPSHQAEVNPSERIAAKVGLADGLADLKPVIEKPFPEGATEGQVCDAIENTSEKDLWVRFGHLVPMHVFGSIFVLDAPSQTAKTIREFIRDKHFGYDSRTAFCNDSLALVYVRSLPEDQENYGHLEGRKTLVKQLSDGLQVKVRESFAFPDNQERLSDYCRSDAELCEALVKLDEANQGRGSCSHAVLRCGSAPTDTNFDRLIKNCLSSQSAHYACVNFIKSDAERQECDDLIERRLCSD